MKMKNRRNFLARSAIATAMLGVGKLALAHGGAKHSNPKPSAAPAEQQEWGIAGDPAAVERTVRIEMTDAMRFVPDRIEARAGETLRIRHHNSGEVMHEMVIGTRSALDAHAEMMMKFPGMEHDEPWMAHVAPGGEGEIVWTFNRAGSFEFACLIPGHYQAGMRGVITVA